MGKVDGSITNMRKNNIKRLARKNPIDYFVEFSLEEPEDSYKPPITLEVEEKTRLVLGV